MPNVRWILPDSHLHLDNNDYGGEPLIDGCVVPYDEMFHEDWLQNQSGLESGDNYGNHLKGTTKLTILTSIGEKKIYK
nr:multiple organellar RNA editing factor 7, mitochondrial isoform X1 [Tanacetum cinerariifolium]